MVYRGSYRSNDRELHSDHLLLLSGLVVDAREGCPGDSSSSSGLRDGDKEVEGFGESLWHKQCVQDPKGEPMDLEGVSLFRNLQVIATFHHKAYPCKSVT